METGDEGRLNHQGPVVDWRRTKTSKQLRSIRIHNDSRKEKRMQPDVRPFLLEG